MESGTECVYEKRQPARGKAFNRLTYARAKYKAKGVGLDGFKLVNGTIQRA